jgi:hypothetical protein
MYFAENLVCLLRDQKRRIKSTLDHMPITGNQQLDQKRRIKQSVSFTGQLAKSRKFDLKMMFDPEMNSKTKVGSP